MRFASVQRKSLPGQEQPGLTDVSGLQGLGRVFPVLKFAILRLDSETLDRLLAHDISNLRLETVQQPLQNQTVVTVTDRRQTFMILLFKL